MRIETRLDTESVGPGFACGEDDDWTMHHESPILDSGGNDLLDPRLCNAGQIFRLIERMITFTMACLVAACSSCRAREGERDCDQHGHRDPH